MHVSSQIQSDADNYWRPPLQLCIHIVGFCFYLSIRQNEGGRKHRSRPRNTPLLDALPLRESTRKIFSMLRNSLSESSLRVEVDATPSRMPCSKDGADCCRTVNVESDMDQWAGLLTPDTCPHQPAVRSQHCFCCCCFQGFLL